MTRTFMQMLREATGFYQAMEDFDLDGVVIMKSHLTSNGHVCGKKSVVGYIDPQHKSGRMRVIWTQCTDYIADEDLDRRHSVTKGDSHLARQLQAYKQLYTDLKSFASTFPSEDVLTLTLYDTPLHEAAPHALLSFKQHPSVGQLVDAFDLTTELSDDGTSLKVTNQAAIAA